MGPLPEGENWHHVNRNTGNSQQPNRTCARVVDEEAELVLRATLVAVAGLVDEVELVLRATLVALTGRVMLVWCIIASYDAPLASVGRSTI